MLKFTSILFLLGCGVALFVSIVLLWAGEHILWERWLQFTGGLFGTLSSAGWVYTFIQRDD